MKNEEPRYFGEPETTVKVMNPTSKLPTLKEMVKWYY